jgi:hypothetical protein
MGLSNKIASSLEYLAMLFRVAMLAAVSVGLWSGDAKAVIISVPAQIDPFTVDLYSDLLNRAPNPTEQAFWHTALAGGLDTGAVGADILGGTEYRDDQISRYVNSLLLRAPGPADYALLGGLTQDQLLETILTSAEYRSHHATDVEYVESLFLNLLGHPADPVSLAAFVQIYDNTGDVAKIVNAIMGSTEYRTDLVTGFYHTLLHRAPDAPGLNAFVTSGAPPETVQEEIIGSPEYLVQANAPEPGSVPEPAVWTLMLIGIGCLGLQLRRRPIASTAAPVQ